MSATLAGLEGYALGIHRPDDRYMLALYANPVPDIDAYTQLGEIEAEGYEAGGRRLTGPIIAIDDGCVCISFHSLIWENSTINAMAGLIYNASKKNRSLCVVNLDEPVISRVGEWQATMPPATKDKALIVFRRRF